MRILGVADEGALCRVLADVHEGVYSWAVEAEKSVVRASNSKRQVLQPLLGCSTTVARLLTRWAFELR